MGFNLFGSESKTDTSSNVNAKSVTNTTTKITGITTGITDLVANLADTARQQAAQTQQAALLLIAQARADRGSIAAAQPAGTNLGLWLGIAASAVTLWWFFRK